MNLTWNELTFEEVLFQLSAPLEGTGGSMITTYILSSVVPVAIIVIVIILFNNIILKDKKNKKLFHKIYTYVGIAFFVITFIVSWHNIGMTSYIKSRLVSGTFIADNYVNPNNVSIKFPEEKRNLIYIYMESGEITFSDKENGGAFDENVIPELTCLAQENEDFSGIDDKLNGAISLYDTTWTMAAMFAETAGLPFVTNMGQNGMSIVDSFMPNVTTLGDILEDNGYKQVFMIGSPAVFSGRDKYFSQHGNYTIKDYNYALNNGFIPDDYYVFWGYEDEKLFKFAKDELLELSQENEPFNLTLLTVDTHFEDGYVCDLCEGEFDDQYSNVYACSSRQITEFVEWIQKQDFYDNTTIIISGDHPTMDADYCNGVDSEYNRKVYTVYINSAVEVESNTRREYSTFDNFPTTLAALGAKIESDRLGLGTNLFSNKETLLEKYGEIEVNEKLQEKSEFLSELLSIKIDTYENYTDTKLATIDVQKTDNENELYVEASQFVDIGRGVEKVSLEIWKDNYENHDTYEMVYDGYSSYSAIVDITKLDGTIGYIRCIVENFDGEKIMVFDMNTDIYLLSECYSDYLAKLYEYKNNKDITIMISLKGAGAYGLTSDLSQSMQKLGLTVSADTINMKSYYAIINGDDVKEEYGNSYLSYTDTLLDGTTYKITSGSEMAGKASTIVIDDINYSRGNTAFNFCIYDNQTGNIIDTSAFYPAFDDKKLTLKFIDYDESSKTSTLVITDIYGIYKDSSSMIQVIYSDTENIDTAETVNMEYDAANGVFVAQLDFSRITSNSINFQIIVEGYESKYIVTDSITSLDYLLINDIDSYCSYLNKQKDNIVVMISANSSNTENTTSAMQSIYGAFDISSEYYVAEDKYLYTVIDKGDYIVQTSNDMVSTEGILSNGESFSINSNASDRSIIIGGVDYSLGRTGINIVVYDLISGEVIDMANISDSGEYVVTK